MSGTPSRGLGVLSVDLGAVRDNWLFLKSKLGAGCDCSAVVKANAYGLGALPVSKTLFAAGCRWFFVATLDEALILRGCLPPAANIAVLHGLVRGEEALYQKENLVPVLNQLDELARWRRAGKNLPAILHLDTGMNRLGFAGAALEKLTAEGADGIDLCFVMSHLSCADEDGHPQNQRQLEKFKALLKFFSGAKASFANSSGIFRGREMHFDLARPGAAIYGINPTPEVPNPQKPVVTLEAEVLQVIHAKSGETAGYGAGKPFKRPTRLATLGLGYADGYFRSFGEGQGRVFIGAQPVPVIGRVSMDLVTVDVTDLPDNQVIPGMRVEVMGKNHRVDALALEGKTIGYEILTALGQRYIRHYIG